MTAHSSIAWRIAWTEEPGRLQAIGLHRVRHDRSDYAAAATDEEKRKAREGWWLQERGCSQQAKKTKRSL